MSESKKAILVVSFGTSMNESREKTIDVIEQTIQRTYPDYAIYRAWTSKMIIRKLLKRDHLRINTVTEAMEQIVRDGVTDLIVQPTHIINGIENDLMKEDVLAYKDHFNHLVIGNPLLTTIEDNVSVLQAVVEEFSDVSKEDVLVFMGHGTNHYANSVYAALDYTFKNLGHENMFMGTVEAYPSMDELLKLVKDYQPKKVHLAPFMVVAGDHANNDMAGDDEESWKSQFQANGFDVECHIKGLGEYSGIQQIFLEHVEDAIQSVQV
jgi:sirohydrochlorin cobaltochelatase